MSANYIKVIGPANSEDLELLANNFLALTGDRLVNMKTRYDPDGYSFITLTMMKSFRPKPKLVEFLDAPLDAAGINKVINDYRAQYEGRRKIEDTVLILPEHGQGTYVKVTYTQTGSNQF